MKTKSLNLFDNIPSLDGVLLTDNTSRAANAVDVGSIVHHTPLAVLQPGSVEDICKMVHFCRRHGIKVAARGQGHSTFGQPQVENGLIINMSTLNTIRSISPKGAYVDAGVQWKTLVQSAFAQGLTPPVLTGFLGLSVGGTLSVGGVSTSYRFGVQVDNVLELEVVTGEGDRITCSQNKHRELFEVVLAGLGQCAIITRTKLSLVPVQPLTRYFALQYSDNATFFSDLRKLLHREEFSGLWGSLESNGASGWVYQINAVIHFTPSAQPDNYHLLSGLSYDPARLKMLELPYLDFHLRADNQTDCYIQMGMWHGVIKPWFDVFLPNNVVEQYVGDVWSKLTFEDVGQTGVVLLFPLKHSALTRPFFRVPDDEWIFLFDILTSAPTPEPNPGFLQRMLDRNRQLFEQSRALGGTYYPIGSVPFSRKDWELQYGKEWSELVRLKHRFDPDNILTPGQGIF